MPFGVMGGDFQPQGHSQVLMNMLDFGMSPQQAGDQPRVAHGGSSNPQGRKGHHIRPGVGALGGYQAIWRLDEPRRYFGGSDPRKDGAAMGY